MGKEEVRIGYDREQDGFCIALSTDNGNFPIGYLVDEEDERVIADTVETALSLAKSTIS